MYQIQCQKQIENKPNDQKSKLQKDILIIYNYSIKVYFSTIFSYVINKYTITLGIKFEHKPFRAQSSN